ncbi:LamB/YcsF family protein [Nonomuraea sp. KC401]|uniref:LamB/YcsF family protein n=1 Tax=unclassified Nonomuraea TaxID=2593643 RepID=UPI0010FD8DDA|nr:MULTISPECIES: 5-oxoprolinase subunit PxpA [unclassified Nonomuraea]NBE99913.1 5-oxoprolinase subunit PxpA [Nonomuraea sp. K271]TLF63150.1 LamB/YcsF family protein [Nonomuraea sp. KC401]
MVIDLNADLGEGYGIWRLGDDLALLDIVTSANVACGFHAGDPVTIRRTCAAAVDRGVAIGAQVSYRDRAHFGRREMDLEPEELCAEVLYQLAAVDGIARAMGGRVSYVKPHGALYNRICRDEVQAGAVIDAVADYDPTLPVLTLPGSVVHEVAAVAGVPTVNEAFADRAYTPAGMLVPRREPDAVIHDAVVVAARARQMAVAGSVTASDGSSVQLAARSICVHGDTPDAVRLAQGVRDALLAAGVVLQAFT